MLELEEYNPLKKLNSETSENQSENSKKSIEGKNNSNNSNDVKRNEIKMQKKMEGLEAEYSLLEEKLRASLFQNSFLKKRNQELEDEIKKLKRLGVGSLR